MTASDLFDGLDPIADSILYEGYALFPYRATSLKNSNRCSIGELSPGDRRLSEVPLKASLSAELFFRVGLLQPVMRAVTRAHPSTRGPGSGDRPGLVSWCEARPHRLPLGPITIERLLAGGKTWSLSIASFGEQHVEGGRAVLRSAAELTVDLEIRLRRCDPSRDAFVLSCSLVNRSSECDGRLTTLHSPHVAAAFDESSTSPGLFISITDAPADFGEVVESCEFDGAWPVLMGRTRDARRVLFSPVILYDYPAIAPESPCDLFDATENDELLLLSILALPDEERAAMRATDPRTAAILARAEELGEGLGRLHGAIRERGVGGRLLREEGGACRVGDRVILSPRGRDAFDSFLNGKRAKVVGIETELEGRVHLVVVLDDDPGRDLGLVEHGLGHRFFVAPDEVRPAGTVSGETS